MAYTVPFLTAKFMGMAYVTMLYFIVGVMMAKVFDKLYGEFSKKDFEENKKSLFQLGLEIIFHMFLITVMLYLLRNIVERIPFPLEGMGGYEHQRLRELGSAPILSVVVVLFQKNFKDKVDYFVRHILD